MSAVDLQIVRECFELSRFRVLTHWRQETEDAPNETRPLLFVENTRPAREQPSGFLLPRDELCLIERAVVEVRAWHADRFYASLVEANPVLGRVAYAECTAIARECFGGAPFTTLLVISELPASHEPRARALEALQGLGLGHVIEFSAILEETLSLVNAHGDYSASASLQTMRLLKRYGLIRRQQLEFDFPTSSPRPPCLPKSRPPSCPPPATIERG